MWNLIEGLYHKIIYKNTYVDEFLRLNQDEIKNLRKNYKIIDVICLNRNMVEYAMFGDEYFEENKNKKQIVIDMIDYYLNHKDKNSYKMTDYLCNRNENICICNLYAEENRKIFSGNNYKKDNKYISWIRKSNKPF